MTTSQCLILQRPEGAIAYDVSGPDSGPLVVLIPGMGDLRASFRFVVPDLLSAGFRVVTTDLRGHGDSDATFSGYGDVETAGDIAALLTELDTPAVLVGNSMAAAASAIVAAEHPARVVGLALVGPLLREQPTTALSRLLVRLVMQPLWIRPAWNAYLPKLFAGRKPTDFAAYRKQIGEALGRPGHAKAFAQLTRTLNHDPAERALARVKAPALIVVGLQDPDYPDPKAEARWMADQLDAELITVDQCGHYPQSQQPDEVGPALVRFVRRVTRDA